MDGQPFLRVGLLAVYEQYAQELAKPTPARLDVRQTLPTAGDTKNVTEIFGFVDAACDTATPSWEVTIKKTTAWRMIA